MPDNEIDHYRKGFRQEVAALESVFARELTDDLARVYVASLIEKLGGEDQSFDAFVEKGKKLHYDVGRTLYGPLIVGYCEWLMEECTNIGYSGDVFFALRDAAPLAAAASVIWKSSVLFPKEIYANRPLLGIEDEIAPEASTQNGAVLAYLSQKGVTVKDQVVWVDTGAWGTVILALKKSILRNIKLYPFFWYSHNPHIPGFVNDLLEQAGVESAFGEVLNDSMECVFPQLHQRPLAILPDSSEVVLIPSTYLSVQWGLGALAGVRDRAIAASTGALPPSLIDQIHLLYQLSTHAKATGDWTGVLPTNTPTWSLGQKFLAEWPDDLLP